MSENKEVIVNIDAGRLLYGLSRIGYTTSSAICDIIDNSVRANAESINVLIEKSRNDLSDNKKNNVKEYVIIDDGDGMDNDGILEALKIGSTDVNYEISSLAKFGLGLKAATFSQGDVLEVISSDGKNKFIKYAISLPEVMKRKEYFAKMEELTEIDFQLINKYLSKGKGTIVRISQVRMANHPSVRSTIKELQTKLGVIYYYFIKKNDLKISIGDFEVSAIDPLFAEEADINGNLNEYNWDGKSVRWIEKNTTLTLDDEEKISVQVEVTQLPYPPIFKLEQPGQGKDAEIRQKYLISSENYGFYVYRNSRLVSWASKLQGIIPQDQDYFAFRGRILINDIADDYFNIDVKKSNLTLSDEAWNAISDFTKQSRSKSKNAWQNVGKHITSIINKEPNEIADNIVNNFEQPELLPGDEELSPEVSAQRLKRIEQDMNEKVKLMAEMMSEDTGEAISDIENLTPQEKEKAIKGKDNLNLTKIFRVTSVADNHLWEPYYDTDLGDCVRINKFHQFARLIYEDNGENRDLQIIFDLLFLQLASAENYSYNNIDIEYDELKKILTEFRRISSEFLANIVRRKEGYLPPNYKSNEYGV